VRQAGPHAVAQGVGQLHLGLIRAAPAVPAGDLAGLRSPAPRGHQRGGLPQDGEPDEPFVLGRHLGGRPLPLAQQHGVAVRVEHLHLTAKRVRRMPSTDDRYARPLQHADHGLDIVIEEVEQQRQRRDVQRKPGRGQQDRHALVLHDRPGRAFRLPG